MMYDEVIVGRWKVGLGMGMKVYDGELAGIARASQKPAGPASLSSTSESLQTTKQQSGTPTNSHHILDTKFHYRFRNLRGNYWTLIWTNSFITLGSWTYRCTRQ